MTKKHPAGTLSFQFNTGKQAGSSNHPRALEIKLDERQNAFMYSTTKDRRQKERETNENAKQPFRGARALFPKYAINTLRRSASKKK